MENPLVILLLFTYLVIAIISLVNMVFRYWRTPGLPAIKWLITLLTTLALFGGVYLYNRVPSGFQQMLAGLVCLIIAGNIAGIISRRRVRAGKTRINMLGTVIITLFIAFMFFSLMVVTARFLNQMEIM